MAELTGKACLVTGGSRGIGRAIALELGRQGAFVAVGYAHNEAAAEEVAAEIAVALGATKLRDQCFQFLASADGVADSMSLGITACNLAWGHLMWEPPLCGDRRADRGAKAPPTLCLARANSLGMLENARCNRRPRLWTTISPRCRQIATRS